MKIERFLPGFKTTYLTVSVVYVLLAGSLFAKGLMISMAGFKVPQTTLDSPHYYDAILWVYTHMIVIGLMIGLMGLYAESMKLKLWMSRLLCLCHIYYTYLDFRSSDSVLGNGLYKGEGSVIPAIISLIITLLFLRLSFSLSREKRVIL